MQLELPGNVAIVTGANHGIGAAISLALASCDVSVLVTYLRVGDHPEAIPDEPGGDRYAALRSGSGEAVAARIRETGGNAVAVEADLQDAATVDILFDHAQQELGPVDILINNAAHWESDSFVPPGGEDSSWHWFSHVAGINADSARSSFDVNVIAPGLMMAAFARRFASAGRKSGRIINISTDAAHCFPGEVSYGASKAALESYTRSAARELGPLGITVNVIAPGPTQTGYISPEAVERLLPQIPARRLGTPADIANTALFLCSDLASWITGQVLYVSGGHEL